MTQDDSVKFLQMLGVVAEVYGAKLSDPVCMMYFDALQDLPLDKVLNALRQSAKTCKFMPKPAELREIIGGSTEDQAELAWLEYKRLARVVGGYRSPELSAILGETILAVFGTWEQACWLELSPEMWANKRREFGRVYHAIATRDQDKPQLTLRGFLDRDAAEKEPPLLLPPDVKRLTE